MSDLEPNVVFDLIAGHIPEDLHEHILIIGSLAAAYHYRDRLGFGGINTKDADVVVQPRRGHHRVPNHREPLAETGLAKERRMRSLDHARRRGQTLCHSTPPAGR